MNQDLTNQMLKLMDPVFQQGYTGEGIDVNRIMAALKRVHKIEFMKEICNWHIDCEKEDWRSQASITIEYDEDRPFIPDDAMCMLCEGENVLSDRLVEDLDKYVSGEPAINEFIDLVVRVENSAAWSIMGWQDRLKPLAGSIGFDLEAYYSACMSQDLENTVVVAPVPHRPGARM